MALIGLYDQDFALGHSKCHSLTLMKISTYHKNRGDSVSFCKKYIPEQFTIFYLCCERVSFIPPNDGIEQNVKLVGGFFSNGAHPVLKNEILRSFPDLELYKDTNLYNERFNYFWCFDDEGEILLNFDKYIDFSNKTIYRFCCADQKVNLKYANKILEILEEKAERKKIFLEFLYFPVLKSFDESCNLSNSIVLPDTIYIELPYKNIEDEMWKASSQVKPECKFSLKCEGTPRNDFVKKIEKYLSEYFMTKTTNLNFIQWLGFNKQNKYSKRHKEFEEFCNELKMNYPYKCKQFYKRGAKYTGWTIRKSRKG